jgi:hypothetical protein
MNSVFDAVAREVAELSTADRELRRERIFFTGMAVVMTLVCIAGFAPSYYLKAYFKPAPMATLVHVHGAAFTLWMLLLVAQTSLIANGQVRLHRKLGIAGGVLAVFMVATGIAVVWVRGTTPIAALPHDFMLRILALSVVALVAFSTLLGFALRFRRKAGTHKRLIMLATTVLVGAAVHRLLIWAVSPTVGPLMFFGVTDLFVVAIAAYDYFSRGRLHPATIWGGAGVVASQVIALVLAGSGFWLNFARWATGT